MGDSPIPFADSPTPLVRDPVLTSAIQIGGEINLDFSLDVWHGPITDYSRWIIDGPGGPVNPVLITWFGNQINLFHGGPGVRTTIQYINQQQPWRFHPNHSLPSFFWDGEWE